MSEYNHDCGSCSASRGSRTVDKSEFLEALNPASSVEKVIGVVSGKGGVGKSLITSMMAVNMNREGKKTTVLDVDITGSSIPIAFGLPNDGVMALPGSKLVLPVGSTEGVEIMSANLLLNKGTNPVIWKSLMIAGAVKQFQSGALWQDVDYMFVDMPPDARNVPLTVFQSLPVNKIITVTSPQELVSMIVVKAVDVTREMDIPIVGIVESMSYLECPDCGKRISVFGEGHMEEVAKEHGIQVLVQIPIDPEIARVVDAGRMEYMEMPWFEHTAEIVEAL